MSNQRLQVVNFFVLLILATLLALLVVWPFAKLILFSVILAILFQPVYKRLEKEAKYPSVAALVTTIFIILIIVLPLLLLGKALFDELTTLYRQAQNQNILNSGSAFWQALPQNVRGLVDSALGDVNFWLSNVTGHLLQSASFVVSHVAGFFLSVFLLLISTYYFLKDGKKIRGVIESVLPISASQESLLFNKIEQAISGVVQGTFLMAAIRGIIVFFGFLVFGIPNPVLWALLFTVVSMIPPIGTGFGFVVAVLYLLLAGHIGSAVGMAILGILIVVVLDTLLAPQVLSIETKIHPLLVLFGILGGIAAFGAVGLIFGPILMSVFVVVLDIYRKDLKLYMDK